MSKQPKREPGDGPVAVNRFGGKILVSNTVDGVSSTVELSEYNAWRVFGMLAVILGVQLPKNIAQAIKM